MASGSGPLLDSGQRGGERFFMGYVAENHSTNKQKGGAVSVSRV